MLKVVVLWQFIIQQTKIFVWLILQVSTYYNGKYAKYDWSYL